MKRYRAVPSVEAADPAVLSGGHLWIQEKVAGTQLRFTLEESGAFRFGDRDRTFEPGEEPLSLEPAVRHVRRSFDRVAFEQALDDPTGVVFFTEATHRGEVPYDLDRLPPVVGFDVYAESNGGYLPVDAVESIFDRLGLEPINALDRELRAVDFRPDTYEFPRSSWYDGPVAGVVVRNKRGGRFQLRNGDVPDEESETADAEPIARTPEQVAESLCSADLLDRIIAEADSTAFDRIFERAIDRIVRTHYGTLFDTGRGIEADAFRSAIAAIVQKHLNQR